MKANMEAAERLSMHGVSALDDNRSLTASKAFVKGVKNWLSRVYKRSSRMEPMRRAHEGLRIEH
jgi:hypothetical protein